MNKIKLLVTWINSIRFIPHLVLFVAKYQKCKDDVKVAFINCPPPSLTANYPLCKVFCI